MPSKPKAKARPKAKPSASDVPSDQPMEVFRLSVLDLSKDPANVRTHGDKNLRAIRASLAKYGQQKPIVVGHNDVVIAGNGTLEAAMSLGWTTIGCVRSTLRGSDATGFAIADNRTSELAGWDVGLADVLRSLQSEDFDMEAVGFNAEDVDRLCQGLGTEILAASRELMPGQPRDPFDQDDDQGDLDDDQEGEGQSQANSSIIQNALDANAEFKRTGIEPPGTGDGLAKIRDVVVAEPKTPVSKGDVFLLGKHTLICCDIMRDWPVYLPLLKPGDMLLIHPSPLAPLSDANGKTLVMVQPDKYLCAMTVDLYRTAYGDDPTAQERGVLS